MKSLIKKLQHGFTIVELIVVIAIIGVLAAILIPMMAGYVKQSQITSCDHIAASARKVISNTIAFLETKSCTIKGSDTLVIYFSAEHENNDPMATFTKDGEWTLTDNNISGSKSDNTPYTVTDVEEALCKALHEEIGETRSGELVAFICNGICHQTVFSTDKDTILSLTDVLTNEDFEQDGCEQGVLNGIIVGTNTKVYTD